MATTRTSPSPSRARISTAEEDIPVVGAREPCPCGSGRRYKACHGRKARATSFVARPFEGLAGERDWVALREFVPAGTARVRVVSEGQDREVIVASVLPMIAPGLVRPDGTPMLGLQAPGGSGDPSRDHAAVLERLLESSPGSALDALPLPEPGPRLQDLLDPAQAFEVEVHDDFGFWADALDDPSGILPASIERANAAMMPTARVPGVEAAYWCRMGDRDYLRWVMPEPEDRVVDALARLHAAGGDDLGAGTRLIGAFRAYGLLVAVWDLVAGAEVSALEAPAADFASRYGEAMAVDSPLSPAERSARAGLLNRQQTLR